MCQIFLKNVLRLHNVYIRCLLWYHRIIDVTQSSILVMIPLVFRGQNVLRAVV